MSRGPDSVSSVRTVFPTPRGEALFRASTTARVNVDPIFPISWDGTAPSARVKLDPRFLSRETALIRLHGLCWIRVSYLEGWH